MHKPLRRMHTSTERFPFSRRSPSKRRAFLGVFNITKSIGRHDEGQRPRISLQIKCCRPITPPIIREKHRRARIFARTSVCRGLRLQNTRKNARRHHPPHGANQNKSAAFLSGALRRTQEALAARSAQRGLLACPRTRREGTCSPPEQERIITRRCKPSCACPRQHQTGCPSGSRGASSSRGRSRCSQPGRSRFRRRRRPCCRSRRPER